MQQISSALRRLHADHFRIARAGLWLLLFTLCAKLAGATKEIAVAWRFGRGPEVDAYNLALTLSTWLPVTLTSVISIVLVPRLIRSGSEASGGRSSFLGELNGVAIVLGGALMVTTWVLASPLSLFFASGLPDTTRQLAVDMLRLLAPLALLTVLIGVYTARLQAIHNHSYALLEGLPALAIVTLLLACQAGDTMPLVAGTLLGISWQAAWLFRRTADAEGSSGIALPLRQHWAGLWRAALVMGAGQLVMSFTVPIDQWFAARVGSGAIATLGYANRIVALGMTLGATVISRATLPIFAEGIASGEADRIRRHAKRWAAVMLLVGATAAFVIWLLAYPLIAFLFERGAFSADDTRAVTEALSWGIWQLPPYLSGLVLMSFMAAQRRYDAIAAVAAVNMFCKVLANYLFTPELALNGILLGSVVMYWLAALLFWVLVMGWAGGSRARVQ